MGIWLAIKLFAGGIGRFFAANWKWIVPLLIVIAAYFLVTNAIDTARREGHEAGYSQAETEFKEKVEEEEARNRKFEKNLETLIGNFGVKIVQESLQRVSKETVLKETLRETIKSNTIYEQCVADNRAIDTRNTIRKLGPEVASAPIRGLDE